MHLDDAEKAIEACWHDLAPRFPTVHLDQMILMPDHLHGILTLGYNLESNTIPRLGTVIQAFKSASTVRYGAGVKMLDWPPFERRFWQRNCFEHIICNDRSLERHREYIVGNPARWLSRLDR